MGIGKIKKELNDFAKQVRSENQCGEDDIKTESNSRKLKKLKFVKITIIYNVGKINDFEGEEFYGFRSCF